MVWSDNKAKLALLFSFLQANIALHIYFDVFVNFADTQAILITLAIPNNV